MSDIRKRTGAKGTTYQVRYAAPGTKTGYAYKSFDTRKEAVAFRETAGTRNRPPKATVLTVPEAVQRWLDICEKIGRDGREVVERETLKEYRRRASVMCEYAWDKPLTELRPADCVQFRNWLLTNKSRDLARRTLSSFHSMLIEMKHQDEIDTDPAHGITIKAHGRYEDDDADVDIPSDDEMRAILAAADRMGSKNDFMRKCWARYRPIVYLAAFSGMRPSEYRGLTWDNIHRDRVEVVQRADKSGVIGPVKSRAGRRTIYLPRLVTDMIFAWKEDCPASELNLVFPTDSGKPLMLNNFATSAWRPLMREAGLVVEKKTPVKQRGKSKKVVLTPLYTPYALRHYFASKLIEKRLDLKLIQEAMGHSKAEITLNVYGHLLKGREEEKKRAAESLVNDLLKTCGESVAISL
ncbi:MAG: site-specific integrase [Pseudacidovorax sp.]|uniref:tyrosine-type recombinase/integrase n=1 Tax=Pseudacidovorax sp. TaxID=1934311 RepID=UPI001B7AA5F9|nr:site-specific integrase [Pseudacidovorax sp.]MBP6895214.1 site-specific integrase [Pseudacidovorax sp.]